mmetsp:Transcript_99333/g.249098  ORF Transcript_99333/g.249098 Transcript_99333/m.249098 type:complete len:80 (+) Transcript_99333:292-531(+)
MAVGYKCDKHSKYDSDGFIHKRGCSDYANIDTHSGCHFHQQCYCQGCLVECFVDDVSSEERHGNLHEQFHFMGAEYSSD